jgi:long-subunit fatty acid transport protein
MKKYIIAIILAASVTLVYGQSKVGTTAAPFLGISVGARATAMGGAFTAVANDATAAYWNPSGLARMERNEFQVSHAEWLVGTRLNWFGVGFKLDENNAFGIQVNQLDYGEEQITTPANPNGTGEYWNAMDLAVSLSYARNLTDRFSIGGSFKYISQRVWNESASAFALDIGLLFHTQLEGLRIGMNIANFGTEMKLEGKDLLRAIDVDPTNAGNNPNIPGNLDTDNWQLPLIFTVGLGYDVIKSTDWMVTLASDAVIPNNNNTYGNVGAEIMWNNLISLRGGYTAIGKEAAEESYTAGIGLQYDFGGFFAKFDYSYSAFGVFKNISRFSLAVGM